MANINRVIEQLQAAEVDTLDQIKAGMEKLDKNTDKRFEAFDEVIQQQMDVIEELLEKVEGIVEKLADDEDKERSEALGEKIEAVGEKIAKIPAPVFDTKPLSKEVDILKSQVTKLAKTQDEFAQMLSTLITARRVPVRDKEGNVIGVELEMNS